MRSDCTRRGPRLNQRELGAIHTKVGSGTSAPYPAPSLSQTQDHRRTSGGYTNAHHFLLHQNICRRPLYLGLFDKKESIPNPTSQDSSRKRFVPVTNVIKAKEPKRTSTSGPPERNQPVHAIPMQSWRCWQAPKVCLKQGNPGPLQPGKAAFPTQAYSIATFDQQMNRTMPTTPLHNSLNHPVDPNRLL